MKANKKPRLRLQTKTTNKLDFKIKTLEEIRQEKNQDVEMIEVEGSTETKENNSSVVVDDAMMFAGEEMENSDNKKGLKRKRTKWSLYQPPKPQRNEKHTDTSLLPKKTSDDNKNRDAICVKTLEEIRAERLKAQGDAAAENDTSLADITFVPSAEPTSNAQGNQKRAADISVLAPFLSKRIRLPTSAANHANTIKQEARAARFAWPSSTTSKPVSAKTPSTAKPEVDILSEETVSSATELLETSNTTGCENSVTTAELGTVSNLTECSSTAVSVEASETKSVSSSSASEARVSSTETGVKRESRLSDAMDDELDLLLCSDDEAEEDISDIKEDELLLQLEQMINR